MHYVIDKKNALLAKNYALFCIFAGKTDRNNEEIPNTVASTDVDSLQHDEKRRPGYDDCCGMG